MTPPYQLYSKRRAPRFRVAETIPAALQFQDHSLIPGRLQVISRSGGLLSLSASAYAEQGSFGTLTFRTHKGLVSGAVEMLHPVLSGHQPFRFVGLEVDHENRMHAAFQSGLYRNLEEEEWIEDFRAAVRDWTPPRRKHLLKPLLSTIVLAMLCLGSLLYAFGTRLIR